MSRSLLLINVVHNTSISKTLLRHGFVDTLRPTCSDTIFVTTRNPIRAGLAPEADMAKENQSLLMNLRMHILVWIVLFLMQLCGKHEHGNIRYINVFRKLSRWGHRVKQNIYPSHPQPTFVYKASNRYIYLYHLYNIKMNIQLWPRKLRIKWSSPKLLQLIHSLLRRSTNAYTCNM